MITGWIILYHHRHGTDCWLEYSEKKPDLNEIANNLEDFESDRDEYLESFQTDLIFNDEDDLRSHLTVNPEDTRPC